MKKVTQPTKIYEGDAWLLEYGDRLHFHAPDDFRDDWEGPRDFDITVRSTILQSRFGERIISQEWIPNGRNPEFFTNPTDILENDFYLRDDWDITVIQPEADDA